MSLGEGGSSSSSALKSGDGLNLYQILRASYLRSKLVYHHLDVPGPAPGWNLDLDLDLDLGFELYTSLDMDRGRPRPLPLRLDLNI